MNTIGQSIPRVDALSKVTGQAKFPADINLPGQVHMKVLFANRPHARVLDIDASKARSRPGVLAVITAEDVPVNEYGHIEDDQPVLCGPKSTKPDGDVVRFIGEHVALVVAETPEAAAQALEFINVTYKDLPVISRMEEALKPGAPLIHEGKKANIQCEYNIRRGDISEGFDQAAHIVEEEYRTPIQEHAYLQTEAGVGYVDDEGVVTVIAAGQMAHDDQEQICHVLDLPLEGVRMIYPAIGGAFGGREDVSVQIILALAAQYLHEQDIDRPVKIVWDRRESIIGHHKRHEYHIKAKWGINATGKLVAAEMDLLQNAGAYASSSSYVLSNATLMCTGSYLIPNVKVRARSVYTNNIPGGAFRGFGGPQAAFVAECQMNRLAEVIDMDPIDLRLENVLKDGDPLSVGTPLPAPVPMESVIQVSKKESGWQQQSRKYRSAVLGTKADEAGSKRRGQGFACAFKNVGFSFGAPEACGARIEIRGETYIDEVWLFHAAAEVGQGAHTALTQMTAEAIGVAIEKVKLVPSDTAKTLNSGSVSASRMTFMAGNAIRGAAEKAIKKWRSGERPAFGEFVYKPPETTALDKDDGHCLPCFAYGYVAAVVDLEVDITTGLIRVLSVTCVDELGRAINPIQVEGQIEGGVVQGLGYTLWEDFKVKDGIPQTTEFSTYLVPTSKDIPGDINSVITETADELGPWGARGMGEMPFLPVAPAVVAAVHDALGIWFNAFPLTPVRVLSSINEHSTEV